jgi:hypothetical protein
MTGRYIRALWRKNSTKVTATFLQGFKNNPEIIKKHDFELSPHPLEKVFSFPTVYWTFLD